MKKFMHFVVCCALVASATGCGSKAPEQVTGEVGQTGKVEESGKVEQTGTGEVTNLTYLAWDVGAEDSESFERTMIEIYDEAHPEVEIEVLTIPEGTDYNGYMATLASSGQMPDVFAWASVPETILNEWSADVSEYALNDEEYKMINPATSEGGQTDGKVYGVPKAMNYMGMYINKDLFEANNVEPLQYGYTMDEMMNAIEKNTTATTKGVDNFSVEAWYPLTVNPEYGFHTYDGEQVHFDSDEYAQGIAYAQKVTQNNWNLVNTTALEFFGTDGWAWGAIGGIALQYDGTWNLSTLADQAQFEYDFIGLPGGHIVLINDYIFVSESCKDKEAAYNFAKWMGYGIDGTLTRFEIAESSDAYTYNSIPLITTHDEINDKFLASLEAYPEFKKAYTEVGEKPELLHVEGFKEIPGFAEAIFNGDTGVQGTDADGNTYSMKQQDLRAAIIKGNYKLSDYASKINDIANQEFASIKEQIEERTK